MRTLVAILVTVAQVAGPWLCCCGPARAFASAPTATKPVEVPADHCPLCAKAKPTGDAAEPAAPSNPGPTLPGRCPCCATKLADALAFEPSRSFDATPAALGFFPPTLAALCPTADVPAPPAIDALPGTSDLPFLTADTRLFTHHALRC